MSWRSNLHLHTLFRRTTGPLQFVSNTVDNKVWKYNNYLTITPRVVLGWWVSFVQGAHALSLSFTSRSRIDCHISEVRVCKCYRDQMRSCEVVLSGWVPPPAEHVSGVDCEQVGSASGHIMSSVSKGQKFTLLYNHMLCPPGSIILKKKKKGWMWCAVILYLVICASASNYGQECLSCAWCSLVLELCQI